MSAVGESRKRIGVSSAISPSSVGIAHRSVRSDTHCSINRTATAGKRIYRSSHLAVDIADVSGEMYAVENGGVEFYSEIMTVFSCGAAGRESLLVEVSVGCHISEFAGSAIDTECDVVLRCRLFHNLANPIGVGEVVWR